MNKTIFILLFFLMSCGYQPIYISKNINQLEYSEIILTGDDEINKKIINALFIKENKNGNKLYLSNSFKNEATSKNTIGQSVSFKTTLNVDLKIESNDRKILENKKFIKEFSYNNKENKIELVEYQNSIKSDLTAQIISEITIYLNSK
mgnify:CR=1 FL=1